MRYFVHESLLEVNWKFVKIADMQKNFYQISTSPNNLWQVKNEKTS